MEAYRAASKIRTPVLKLPQLGSIGAIRTGLFDSQNNAASGYQIGDDCKPACKDP